MDSDHDFYARRLGEIQRQLEDEDPRFAARMRDPARARRRRVLLLLYLLAWALPAVLGVLVGWLAAVAAVWVLLGAGLVLAFRYGYRRR